MGSWVYRHTGRHVLPFLYVVEEEVDLHTSPGMDQSEVHGSPLGEEEEEEGEEGDGQEEE